MPTFQSSEPSPNGNGMSMLRPSEDFKLFSDGGTVSRLSPALREKFAADPALEAPGVAPNYSQWILPHVMTLQGLVTSISRVYRVSDEALNDSFDNARFMEYDVGIRECLEARMRDSVLLDWHIDPEDDKDPEQVFVCGELTKIVKAHNRWRGLLEQLTWADWYGRSAVSLKIGWKQVGGNWYTFPVGDGAHPGWLPVHGDKLVFRLMDDRLDHPQNQVGIRVGQTYHAGDRISKRSFETVDESYGGDYWRVEPTDRGLAYFLSPYEAKQLIVHKYQIQDAAFERPIDAGRIHGVGIRSVLYWEWFMEKEALRWLMEFIERSAFGLELWYYPLGNDKARQDTETAIKKRVGPYRNALLVPVPPEDGGPGKQYGVDHIETGAQGADLILGIIEKYFGHRRKRYMLGQVLTTEAEATGLGGNLASIHLLSYRSVIRYTTGLRDESVTPYINQLKNWNFPGNGHWSARYVTETEPVEADVRLNALQMCQNMGAPISKRQVYEAAGVTPPQPDEELAMPAMAMGMGPDGEPLPPPGMEGEGGPVDEAGAPAGPEGPEDTEQFSLAGRLRNMVRTTNRRMAHQHAWALYQNAQNIVQYGDRDLRDRIKLAAKTTHTKPTKGQREAGNYRKGCVSVHGIEVCIENPKGSYRKYKFEGKTGKQELKHHYGYIKGTEGRDDGQLDCFIGPDPESDLVYIVDQVNPRTGDFDELKVLIGWYCTDEAKEGYLANYEKGWQGLGKITMLTMPQFKKWLAEGNQKKSMEAQKKFYSQEGEVDQYAIRGLPPIPEGMTRLTHFTSQRAAKAITEGGFNYAKQGHIGGSTDAFSHNEHVHQLLETGKTGAFSRGEFGTHTVVMDMPHSEHRLHSNIVTAPGTVHPSRVVGTLNRETGDFQHNPDYNPHHEVEIPHREHQMRGSGVSEGHPKVPVPSPSSGHSSVDVFSESETDQYAIIFPSPRHTSGQQQGTQGQPASQARTEGLRERGGLRGGSQQLESSHPTALGTRPLAGLPRKVKIPGQGEIEAGPHHIIRAVAHDYMKSAGLEYHPPTQYHKVDKDRAKRIADAYEAMPHNPEHPDTKAAYDAMIRETLAQYQHIKKAGLKVSTIKPGQKDPYAASPRLATEDIKNNNHFHLFPTISGFGTDQSVDVSHNPLLGDSGEKTSDGHPMTHNDVFRVVHDYFGHAKEGNGFRADGEENAWRSHAAMYSPLARKAMTSETRGQNSWLNYGPHGDKNRTAKTEDTTFATQKSGLLPDWVMEEGRHDLPEHEFKAHYAQEEGEHHTTELTHEIGTHPIPEGHLRVFHYTKAPAEKVRKEGLKLSHAKGTTYGEPNYVWGSENQPGHHHTIVEFHVPHGDPAIAFGGRHYTPENWKGSSSHIAMTRDIHPHEIVAVHEPWHHAYHYIKQNPEVHKAVLAGEHDVLAEKDDKGEYKYHREGPAVTKIKEEAGHTSQYQFTDTTHRELDGPSFHDGEWF